MDAFQYLIMEQKLFELAETLGQRESGKYSITDVAISKIPYVIYPGLDNNQNLIIHELAEYVLKQAKEDNNSNEVAVTYDLSCDLDISNGLEQILEKTGVCYGTENDTNLFSDTQSMSIIMRASDVVVVNIHNHPGCSPFSTVDISSFLKETSIKLMIVIGNNGELHYLSKELDKYNHDSAREYLTQAGRIVRPDIDEKTTLSAKDQREVADLFLKNCKNFGIDYRHVLGSSRKLEKEHNALKNRQGGR